MKESFCGCNIQFGIYGADIIKDRLKRDGYTAIFVITESVPDERIREYAKILIKGGCRDYAFCGVEAEKWHRLFDLADIEITEEDEDFSTTWNIEGIEQLPDRLGICNDDVFIFCADPATVCECQRLIAEQYEV